MRLSLSLMGSKPNIVSPVPTLPGPAEIFRIFAGFAGRSFFSCSARFIYRLASALLPQDRLVLYSSSPGDGFGNIFAVAQCLEKQRQDFDLLTLAEVKASPLRNFVRLARAKVLLIDASSPAAIVPLNPDTLLVHCWHAGGAYKKMGFDAPRPGYEPSREEKRISRIHRNIAWFICSSPGVADIYARAFRLRPGQVLPLGLPRLDAVLRQDRFPEPSVFSILYAPTFRTRDGVRSLPPLPDAALLRKALEHESGEKIRLAFRGHPTSPPPARAEGWEDWTGLPLHQALRRASILITDYSSVFFDFLPYARPVVFYVPDFADYQRRERGLYFSPCDLFPDTTCDSEEALARVLVRSRHEKPDHAALWEKYMGACDGRASERLAAFLLRLMEEKA